MLERMKQEQRNSGSTCSTNSSALKGNHLVYMHLFSTFIDSSSPAINKTSLYWPSLTHVDSTIKRRNTLLCLASRPTQSANNTPSTASLSTVRTQPSHKITLISPKKGLLLLA